MEPKDEPFIFTRYLYPKVYVKISLLISLLNHNYDESLFWTYELYFSGFEDETYDYVFKIYDDIYKYYNPRFIKTMEEIRKSWYKNTDQDWLIGSIVANLTCMDYRMDLFMKKYYNIQCSQKPIEKKGKLLIIYLKEKDIYKYLTLRFQDQPRKYLKNVCEYPIHNNVIRLLHYQLDNIQQILHYEWLYYACGSPVWLDRLYDFNGKRNLLTSKIEFDNEDDEEAFYNKYGLEPDEQTLEIQEKLIGNKNNEQIGLQNFCNKYGCPIITKTIKIQKK